MADRPLETDDVIPDIPTNARNLRSLDAVQAEIDALNQERREIMKDIRDESKVADKENNWKAYHDLQCEGLMKSLVRERNQILDEQGMRYVDQYSTQED